MAIAVEDTLDLSGSSDLSGALVVSGTNPIVVSTHTRKLASNDPAPTYNSISLVEDVNSLVDNTGKASVFLFYLTGPSTSSNTLAETDGAGGEAAMQGTVLSDVDQTTPRRCSAVATGVSTTTTVDVSSSTTDRVVGAAASEKEAITAVGDAQVNGHIGDAGAHGFGHSNEPGTSTVTHSYTGANKKWAILAASFQEAGASEPDATAAQALPALTSAGVGVQEFKVTAAQAFAVLTQAGVGVMHPDVAASQAFAALTQSGAGLEDFKGAGVQTLSPLAQAGAGIQAFPGAAAQALAALAQSGTGVLTFATTAGQIFAALVQAGVGVHAETAVTAELTRMIEGDGE